MLPHHLAAGVGERHAFVRGMPALREVFAYDFQGSPVPWVSRSPPYPRREGASLSSVMRRSSSTICWRRQVRFCSWLSLQASFALCILASQGALTAQGCDCIRAYVKAFSMPPSGFLSWGTRLPSAAGCPISGCQQHWRRSGARDTCLSRRMLYLLASAPWEGFGFQKRLSPMFSEELAGDLGLISCPGVGRDRPHLHGLSTLVRCAMLFLQWFFAFALPP